MKKAFSIFAVLLLTVGYISAQTDFGVRTSIGYMNSRSSTSYVTRTSDYVTHQVNFSGSSPVYSVGIFGQAKIGYLWVSTDILYTTYKMKYNVKSFLQGDTRYNNGKELTESNHYIDIPVLAGVHSNNFRLGVGPVVHILAKLNSEFNDLDFYVEKTRKLTFGFTGVIGYDWNNLHFDFSYENIFRGLGYHINYNTKNSRFKGSPGHIKLAVGFSF